MKKTVSLAILIFACMLTKAQLPDKLKAEKITLKITNENAAQVFDGVAKKINYKFCYSSSDIDKGFLMTFDFKKESLENVLDKIALLTGLQFKVVNRYICVFKASLN